MSWNKRGEETMRQRIKCCKGSGVGGTPYNDLYGEAPPEKGSLVRLQVY